MENITIRKLQVNDATIYRACRLRALQDSPKSFGADFASSSKKPMSEFIERATSLPDNFIVGAFNGDNLVGTFGFFAHKNIKLSHRGTIWGVYIDPDFRGHGLGKKMLKELISQVQKLEKIIQIELAVATLNAPAFSLYKSLGFETYGTEPRAMLVDDEYVDEYLMVLKVG